MTHRTFRLALFTVCVGLASVVAAEGYVLIPSYSEPSGAAAQRKASEIAIILPSNIDAMVAEILARPLFSSSRMAAPVAMPEEEVVVEKKEPPKLLARLTGVTLGPDAREALFQRDGDQAVPLKVGGEIDGWKVSSIQFDQVVLSSEFGTQVVKLTSAPPDPNDEDVPVVPKRAVPAQAGNAKGANPIAIGAAKPVPPRGRQQGRK